MALLGSVFQRYPDPFKQDFPAASNPKAAPATPKASSVVTIRISLLLVCREISRPSFGCKLGAIAAIVGLPGVRSLLDSAAGTVGGDAVGRTLPALFEDRPLL